MSRVVLDKIKKNFGDTTVLNELSLSIEDGEFLVLVGASGCGKSTLLRIVAGLEKASEGELICDDEVITEISPRERNFSMIFQSYALFPHMTVEQNITFGMRVRGENLRQNSELVAQTVEMLQLSSLLKRRPKALSGGQRQRVAMARAIVRNPRLFLMDEPLSNLDAKLRHDVRNGIMALHQRLKTTTIYVTHDQVEAMTMADRIVVLDQGQIQQIGTPDILYRQPDNLFVARFIGSPSMNLWHRELTAEKLHFAGWCQSFRSDCVPDSVWVGIRPEHIKLGEGNDDRCQLTGRLKRCELLGHVQLLHLETSLGTLQMFCENEATLPALGDTLTCHFLPERIHLFSGATERRISDKDLL